MSAGSHIGASGSLSRARELLRQGALDAADAMVNVALAHARRDADAPGARAGAGGRSRTAGFLVLR
jgi:hypothetical protein